MRFGTAPLLLAGLLTVMCPGMRAQTPSPAAPVFTPLPALPFDLSGPVLRARSEEQKPFTVAGEKGVLLGQQDGTLEAWVLPVKVLSHLTIEADIQGYTVPIDVNRQAAEVEVRPDRTVITYSHIGFTVRQIMFSPNGAAGGTGPVVLFQFDCLHPTDFTFRFTPELRWMWPERNEGTPSVEWVAPGPHAYERPGGFYVLHSDYPDFAAAVTMPGARPGILAPYQERPQFHPAELKVHIDPEHDRGRLYPLLMALATTKGAANSGALGAALEKLNQGIAAEYKGNERGYRALLDNSASIDTPDKLLNQDFQWAVTSIEQLRAHPVGTDETALAAGYYASGDSARPGFGWFFGRDALYTLYAVNGYGDFGLAKSELEFLIHRQRADGKIMHEYSQTAAAVDWQQFPYMYAAADSTPLFLLAMLDYVRASGDVDFLRSNRGAVEKAEGFETAHLDANGIYSNAQGTGWVESWPGGMPHQEIYLALLDQQASAAMAQLYDLLQDPAKAREARRRAEEVARTINAQFYDAEKGCYAFSRNENGSLDRTTTVFPAVAWWSGSGVSASGQSASNSAGQPGSSILEHPEGCLRQFAEAALDTDWGLRDVSDQETIYDGMSYHQGSVWPLFTGWASLAEYRAGQPLAGYRLLMENADLTRTQDLGAVTELLSGDFFVPFGRSTSHQLWSSAMVITPILRGLFGIEVDAESKTVTVDPHLPASWDHAAIRKLPLPDGPAMLTFTRQADRIEITLAGAPTGWRLRSGAAGFPPGVGPNRSGNRLRDPSERVEIAVPPLEMEETGPGLIETGIEHSPDRGPLPGARTTRIRIVHTEYGHHKLTITAEGLAGSEGSLSLVRHVPMRPKAEADQSGGSVQISMREPSSQASVPALLVFQFPQGEGWKMVTATLSW